MKNQQQRRAVNWREVIGMGVLLSLVAAMVYVIVVLILAPAHTQHIFERTKGDYVLMLLQCLLGIVALVYLVPVVLFLLGYFATEPFIASENVRVALSIIGFLAGLLPAVFYDRHIRRTGGEMTFTIVRIF